MATPKQKGLPKTAICKWDPNNNTYVAISGGMAGSGTHGEITLSPADTWVAIPATAPTEDYILIIKKVTENGTVRYSFDNTDAPASDTGIPWDDTAAKAFYLAGGEQVYVGSTDNADTVNYTTKLINS